MNVGRLVDQVRTSRGHRQQAEHALLSIEKPRTTADEGADEHRRIHLLVQAATLQNQAIAALEQALLAAGEVG